MQLKLVLKLGIILLLSLLLLVPLGMVEGLVGERQSLRDGVLRDIASASVDAQQVIGPMILVPYKRRVVDVTTEEKDGKTTSTRRERTTEGRLTFFPERLSIAGELVPEERHRGIYKAMLYEAGFDVAGQFSLPRHFGIDPAEVGEYEFAAAMLVFGVSDPRGIAGPLQLDWRGTPAEFGPGTEAPGFRGGATAVLGKLELDGAIADFRFAVKLKGLSRIDFVPTGKDSTVRLKADWPHPSFYGRYLPQSEIDDKGFRAEWRTSFLSTNIKQVYERCLGGRDCAELSKLAHGVALFQPFDIYQQLARSAKYGFLFVGLTFGGFFLYEVLKRLQIHPIQYGLVGAGLAMFFLLLTSLSEHIDFALAYAAASAACVALIGVYVCYVLRSVVRGLLFGGLLAGLYGMLFVLVRAEDSALLMGSAALFAMLAAVMIGTRKVNWYAVEVTAPSRPAPPAG